MKYGLSRDDKLPGSKKKWKILMEHEISSLKFELLLLKEQLHESANKVKQLTSINRPETSASSKGCEVKFNSARENDNNNIRIELTIKNEEHKNKGNQFILKTPSWPANITNAASETSSWPANIPNAPSKTSSWPANIPSAPFETPSWPANIPSAPFFKTPSWPPNIPSAPSETSSWPANIFNAPFDSEEKFNASSRNDKTFSEITAQNAENLNPFALRTPSCPIKTPVAPFTTFIGFNLQTCNTRSVKYQASPGEFYISQNDRDGSRFQCITAMPAYRNWSMEELRWQDYAIAQHHHHQQFTEFGLKGVFSGTELTRFYPTWGSDPVTKVATSLQCITGLSLYQDKSFEELRLEDYILKSIVTVNQLKNQGNMLRPTKTARRSSFTLNESHNKFSNKVKKNSGCWPVIDGDISMTTEPVGPQRSWARDNHSSHITWEPGVKQVSLINSAPQEHLLCTQVLSEFKNIDRQLSTMNKHQLNMDAHLSEMRSRLSVMDSRLSAVDMSIKVQQVNKKFDFLKPTLANLAKAPTQIVMKTSPADTQAEESSICHEESVQSPSSSHTTIAIMSEAKSCSERETLNMDTSGFPKDWSSKLKNTSFQIEMKTSPAESQTEGSSNCGVESVESPWSSHTAVAVMSENKLFSDRDTLKMDISGLPKDTSSNVSVSLENTSLTAKPSQSLKQMSTSELLQMNNAEEKSLNESKVRNDDSVENILPSIEKNSQNVDHLKTDINTEIGLSTSSNNPTNSLVCENNLGLNTEEQVVVVSENNVNKTESAVVLAEIEVGDKQQTSVTSELKVLSNEENHSDVENEYVIVEKTDTFNFTDQNSEGQCSVVTESSSSDFKLCSDITEYLEVNLGKKKNVVYEFGFEAKPDFSPADTMEAAAASENDTGKDGNKALHSEKLTKDDSFLNFLTSFVEDNSVKLKQSSPFTMTQKKPENTQEKQEAPSNPAVVNHRLIPKERPRIVRKSFKKLSL